MKHHVDPIVMVHAATLLRLRAHRHKYEYE